MATEFVKRGMGCSITISFSAQHNLAPEMIHPITPPMAINTSVCYAGPTFPEPDGAKVRRFSLPASRQQLKEINLRGYTPDHKKSLCRWGKCLT